MNNIKKKKFCNLEKTLFEFFVLVKIKKEVLKIGVFMPIF